MIELTQEQRQAVERGDPVRVSLDNRDVVLLRCDVHRRIQAILEDERAVIAAGHTRGPVDLPEPLEALPLSGADLAALGDVALLPSNRYEEIRELVADDRQRRAWLGTVGAAQNSWAREKPY